MQKSIFILLCLLTLIFSNFTIKETYTCSFYHDKFNGRKTFSGEKFNNQKLTCATRPEFEIGSKLKITNIKNDKSVIVTVNDRIPPKSRDVDLSKAAFASIASLNTGVIKIKIEKL